MRAFTDSELATILCGLRMVQAEIEGDEHSSRECTHYDAKVYRLSADEIDELCEEINTAQD